MGVKNSSAEVDGESDLNAATDGKKLVRCLPFDRISFLKLICEKHPLSAKMKKFLTPENYYEDCFGIYRMENVPVEKIRIPSPLDLAVTSCRNCYGMAETSLC